MKSICVLWAQYGPYHLARVSALRQLAAPAQVHAIELASRTEDYAWRRSQNAANLITLCPNTTAERVGPLEVFRRARRLFEELGVEVCFLPSYAPKQSLAALLAAKSLGLHTVMMNESHAGTTSAGLMGTWLKRRLVGLFDSALVGGIPQANYFRALGLPPDKIFPGYDAVDNDYFSRRADEVRASPGTFRRRFALPRHYFLSLGRFLPKKNLTTLIKAYHAYLGSSQSRQTHLVMVGSGAEENRLRSLCAELQLPIYDKAGGEMVINSDHAPEPVAGVHFHGFRQVEENPVFYALADAFILPSTREEWGLVVNEAMASGLPVVVSQTAGCAQDLLEAVASRTGTPRKHAAASPELKPASRANGFVFDPASPRQLGDILLELEERPELRYEMARESRRIVEKCSCERFAENARKAAKAALGESGPAPAPRSKTILAAGSISNAADSASAGRPH